SSGVFWVVYSSTHYLQTIKDKNGLYKVSFSRINDFITSEIWSKFIFGPSVFFAKRPKYRKQANLCLISSSPSFWPEELGGHLEY
ncbi:MAG: hypothetical protein MJE68_29665, partial [Proteobacteria bacterium]|nr:hypothetical protein [Pseudomonadota bacterium]